MSEEVLVEIAEPAEMLEENFTLLPYIKVDDENMMILNGEVYEQDDNDATVLCIPVCETLFDCNIETELIEDPGENSNILSDHNYHNSNENSDNMIQLHSFEVSQGVEKGVDDPIKMYYANVSQDRTNESLVCALCEKVLRTPAAFYRHLRTHTGDKPYQCELCDKKFSQQSNLWKHVLIHTGETRFKCSFCDKKFSQRANMQKHMMVHTGEKPYVCYFCSRAFTQRANLNKHIRIHTGEKPYSCKYCQRRFAQQSNMQKHELLHEGLKPYLCPICSVAFTQQSNLKKHIDTHSSYSCLICDIPFTGKTNLDEHLEQCGGEFVDKSKMQFVIKSEPIGNNCIEGKVDE